jgi:N-acetylglucosamine-6-phosphate deacetylase
MVTIAPELPGSREFIEKCPAIVSLGHSDADYETAKGAMNAGVRCLTHTFNAMPPIHHRSPGPIIAAAENENVYAQIIADGKHIHPAVLRMIIKLMGKERIILISDSMRACGMPDGEYDLGGQMMTVKNGVALTADGRLAGSTSTLIECVKFLISSGFDEDDAVMMASENPARLMGITKGKIEVGYDADFIFVDDSFNLKKVMINGRFCK